MPGLPTALVLRGPPGVGKTASAYAVAAELGFRVLEVNPGADRSGPQLRALVGEATQSRWARGRQGRSALLGMRMSVRNGVLRGRGCKVSFGKCVTLVVPFVGKTASPWRRSGVGGHAERFRAENIRKGLSSKLHVCLSISLAF